MNRLNHRLYQEEEPMYNATYTLEVHPPCLGLVVVLNESRMVELLETERKYLRLLEDIKCRLPIKDLEMHSSVKTP